MLCEVVVGVCQLLEEVALEMEDVVLKCSWDVEKCGLTVLVEVGVTLAVPPLEVAQGGGVLWGVCWGWSAVGL